MDMQDISMIVKSAIVYPENKIKIVLIDGTHMAIKVWERNDTLFSNKEMKLFGGGYFTIIRIEENYIEMVSNNTRHQWIIFKRSIDSNKPVTLYHKHTADTKYYHKHWETWTVAMVVESIKNHDTYVIENGKNVRWMKQKGRVNYGSI